MTLPIETVRGSPYEMGVQHGRLFRHVVHGNVHNVTRHTFENEAAALDGPLAAVRAGEELYAPWVFEELRGIADGSGTDVNWVTRMHFRVWNRAPRAPYCDSGCTTIGIIADDQGVLVGGNLDDPRLCYILIRRIPRDGIPHVHCAWAGAGWGHNGMNAAGLCVVQASLGNYEPAAPAAGPVLQGSMLTRLILQTCENVPQALALLQKVKSESSLVMGDARGHLVSCQCLAGFEPAVQQARDHGNMVFNTNHIHMPELIAAMAAKGMYPLLMDQSRRRFRTLEEAHATAPRNLATLKSLLRSHRRFPDSICRDGNVMSSFGLPQDNANIFYAADRPACANEYDPFVINPDAAG